MKVIHGLATALYMDKALEAMRSHISKSKTDVSLDELTEAYGRSLLLREEPRFKAPSDNYPKTVSTSKSLSVTENARKNYCSHGQLNVYSGNSCVDSTRRVSVFRFESDDRFLAVIRRTVTSGWI